MTEPRLDVPILLLVAAIIGNSAWLIYDLAFGAVMAVMFLSSFVIAIAFTGDTGIRGDIAALFGPGSGPGVGRSIVLNTGIGIIVGLAFLMIGRAGASTFQFVSIPTMEVGATFAAATSINVVQQVSVGTSEELLFRSSIGRVLTTLYSPHIAGVIQALGFAFMHFAAYGVGTATAGLYVAAFVFGVAMWYLGRFTGSWITSIVAHITYNVAFVLMMAGVV